MYVCMTPQDATSGSNRLHMWMILEKLHPDGIDLRAEYHKTAIGYATSPGGWEARAS